MGFPVLNLCIAKIGSAVCFCERARVLHAYRKVDEAEACRQLSSAIIFSNAQIRPIRTTTVGQDQPPWAHQPSLNAQSRVLVDIRFTAKAWPKRR